MKKFFLLLSFLLFFSAAVLADYLPGQVLVELKTDPADFAKRLGRLDIRSIERVFKSVPGRDARQAVEDRWKVYKINFDPAIPVAEVIAELVADPNVVYAEPNYVVKAFATTPNDPYCTASGQWGIFKIKAPEGWDITTGSAETTIAILDSGIDYNHADLSGKVILGYDFINGDWDPMDDAGHGTECSGVAAAITNNAEGIAGVNWKAKLVAVKVLDKNGTGDSATISNAIRWAGDQGYDVLSMSFGQSSFSTTMRNAVTHAYDKGCVMAAAAGNDGESAETYPAAYDYVMAVAATDSSDKRSVWGLPTNASNYGTWVDVSAPGTSVRTTTLGGGYGAYNGTSFSAPFVAGLAGLITGKFAGLTVDQVIAKIKESTDDIDPLNPGYEGKLGTGRINVFSTLTGAIAAITSPASGSYLSKTAAIVGQATGWQFKRYIIEVSDGGTYEAITGYITTSVESGVLTNWDTGSRNGSYTIRLTVETDEPTTAEASVSVIVDNLAPEALITSPVSGSSVEGSVVIKGTAKDLNFQEYILEYGAGSSPATYERIIKASSSVEAGTLGTWDTTGLSGEYTLRLLAYDKAGNMSSTSVLVTVKYEPPPDPVVTSAVKVGPNPVSFSVSDKLYFSYDLNTNFDTEIFIYDITGNLIWKNTYSSGSSGAKAGANLVEWNGDDLFGGRASSGVYLYQVSTSGAGKKIIGRGKLIVL